MLKSLIDKLQTAVIVVWTIVATTTIGITVILCSFFSRTGNFPHLLARLWANSILWVSRVKITVVGAERLDQKRSYIYMANHQSNADIPLLLGRLPVQFRWLAKAELFRIPIFGRAMRGVGYISIDRSNRKSAFESLTRAARTIRDGTSVLIFPEGTRSPDGNLLPFKKGGFVLAVDSGVPIVPIVIRGTRDIVPKGHFMIRPTPVRMEILDPLETADYTRKTKDALLQRVRTILTEHLENGPQES
ncbi:1-acyl-sn-glycerol-3-phosphate acyltransferase [Desulfosarcina ovata subsp. sediminis]|uniref:1-acyl-sn-glycerol-3-phosphate acyltransferase n=1 Tax=Desulfosarcina ovata subsp. sediminis TaxID=885957 RepID=A0A5K7ZJ67_9BACT|nr:lysophospholipid acyltransferase family protein [Desulfosarcina ovata]BBO82182.1 1-acyl-sn-glycerol-3-phosphate acyltransferase [Desulfosarcina ovata subsp. sediminis]